MLTTAIAGFGFGLSLIVAIGAQNAFVLRQGLRREHVGLVVVICALSDLVLIALGTAGLGGLISARQQALKWVSLAGAAVLAWYGLGAARRAMKPSSLIAEESGRATATASVAATALGLTWLNPHVYLDTVILLGSLASTQQWPWVFAAGAMAASLVWFGGLGYGARLLRPLFARPGSWRVLDLFVCLVMVSIAVSLVAGALG